MWGGTGLPCPSVLIVPISIHPPRVGRDALIDKARASGASQFQSTLPVWGGTPTTRAIWSAIRDFNPPSPCGEGRGFLLCDYRNHYFNPPSPCGEGLRGLSSFQVRPFHFNPPSPCGEGHFTAWAGRYDTYFNPPSPCGEGRVGGFVHLSRPGISIHPPRVGRDDLWTAYLGTGQISIHPPRVGRDVSLIA